MISFKEQLLVFYCCQHRSGHDNTPTNQLVLSPDHTSLQAATRERVWQQLSDFLGMMTQLSRAKAHAQLLFIIFVGVVNNTSMPTQ